MSCWNGITKYLAPTFWKTGLSSIILSFELVTEVYEFKNGCMTLAQLALPVSGWSGNCFGGKLVR